MFFVVNVVGINIVNVVFEVVVKNKFDVII